MRAADACVVNAFLWLMSLVAAIWLNEVDPPNGAVLVVSIAAVALVVNLALAFADGVARGSDEEL